MYSVFLSMLFLFCSPEDKNNIREKLEKGAVIIDVRNPEELASYGSINGAINIPFGIINQKTEYLKQLKKPIIFCCASGGRSEVATNYFKDDGIDVTNGGTWQCVLSVLEEIEK